MHSLRTYRRFLGIIKPELLQGSEAERLAWLRALDRAWQVSPLRAPLGRRLVVIAPHPDDETIGPGGLLLGHRHRSEVHVVNVFRGEGGGRLLARPEGNGPPAPGDLVEARRKELAAAAAALGVASVKYLDFQDGKTSLNTQHADRLGEVVRQLRPEVVLLPWYLDNHGDHRASNVLFAWSCRELECMVLGYETWTPCPPNAVFDITELLEEKLAIIRLYETQLETVDYLGYASGLARVRGFLHGGRARRSGAAEGYFALPNRDYCDLVTSFYGARGEPNPAVLSLF